MPTRSSGTSEIQEDLHSDSIERSKQSSNDNHAQLPLAKQISQFQDYMEFSCDPESTLFPNGTVFYNVKETDSKKIIRFGFTKINNVVTQHKPYEEWDTTTFHGKPLEVHVDEHEFRTVFSGMSKTELCNAILGGRIYVSPWEMRSVYNFACSFNYGMWDEFYEMQRLKTEAEAKIEKEKKEAETAASLAGISVSAVAAPAELAKRLTTVGSAEDTLVANNDNSNTRGTNSNNIVNSNSISSSNSSIAKSSLAILLAGTVASSFEALVMHPLDLLKTRFQLSSQRLHVLTHLITISKESAVPATSQQPSISSDTIKPSSINLLRLWRGSFPAVAMQAPRGALKFSVNSLSKNWFSNSQYQHIDRKSVV